MKPSEKTYRVDMTALASVYGCLYIKAESKADAVKQALSRSGYVSWSYDGAGGSSIKAVAELT